MGRRGKRKVTPTIPLDGGVDEYHDPKDVKENRCVSCVDFHITGGKLVLRPCRVVWGPDLGAGVKGVHEYVDTDGTSRILVKTGSKIVEVDASTSTDRDTGLADERVHFHTHRGRCYYNGPTIQRKITGTTADRIGVVAPTAAPTVAIGAATGITGSYAYKFTYAIKESGVVIWESNLSPVSNTVNPTDEKVTVTPSASADSRVNCRRIYRTTASGSVYQYDGEIDNNTAGATFTSEQADALLGAIAEDNHGVPAHGSISEGCNERMFYIDEDKLRYSEQAQTESYLEYQVSTNYHNLPRGGHGTGLKRAYNIRLDREDLFVFQNNSIHVLPGGNPLQSLLTLTSQKGCIQQDTIVERDGSLVFLSNQDTVEYITPDKRIIDISTRSWPTSLAALYNKDEASAALIFNHYYVLSARQTDGNSYHNVTWVCDLRTIREVQPGVADAKWYRWDINAEYILSTSSGLVLGFDNNANRIFSYALANKSDLDAAGNETIVQPYRESKDFTFGLHRRFRPHHIAIMGRQTGTLEITPYYGDNYRSSSISVYSVQAGELSIAGQAVAGQAVATQVAQRIEGGISSDVAGVWVSFKIAKPNKDLYMSLTAFEFTYTPFEKV